MKRPGWYQWAAILASSLTTGALAVAISLHAQAESERKLCGVVVTMDDSYRETPARTPAGQNLQDAISGLRRDLDCP